MHPVSFDLYALVYLKVGSPCAVFSISARLLVTPDLCFRSKQNLRYNSILTENKLADAMSIETLSKIKISVLAFPGLSVLDLYITSQAS